MKIIDNWLNGTRNFIAGRALYKVYGSNEALKELLQNGETDFARKQLTKELTEIAAGTTPVPVKQIVKEAEEMPYADDAILQALRNEWLPLFQRMNLLRHELDRYDDQNTADAIAWRQPRARQIKQLEQEIMKIWAKRDYYQEHGKLPFVADKKTDVPTDPLQLGRLVESLKKNIRRNRKLMNENPGEAKYVQLYNQYRARYKEITGGDYKENE